MFKPDPFRAAQAPVSRRNFLAGGGALALLAACGGGNDPAPVAGLDVAGAARASTAASTGTGGLAGVVYGQVMPARTELAAAGLRKLGGTAALTRNDLMMIGSNTKAMTAAVAGRLVERGLIGWDTTIAEALPDVAATMLDAYRCVTLEQLLDHRGGVEAFNGGDEFATFAEFLGAIPEAELPVEPSARRRFFAAWVLTLPPPAGIVPGRDYAYSNAGYAIAAAMLEARTGATWAELFDEHITRALGVAGGWIRPELVGPGQPFGHQGAPASLAVADPYPPEEQAWFDVIAPAGLLTIAPAAYATWLRWHLLALQGQSTPLATGYVQRLRALGAGNYAMGWLLGSLHDRPVLFHLGEWLGFTALAAVDQAGLRASFGLTNTAFASATSDDWVATRLNDALSEIDLRYR